MALFTALTLAGGAFAVSAAVRHRPNWTFTLRDNVTFHDGEIITSADVAYTFEHILEPTTESPRSRDAGADRHDRDTGRPNRCFPTVAGPLLLISRLSGVIPADSAETIGETGIGTGPFKLETLDVEGATVLTANDDYWQGQPGLAAIELPSIADSQARALALQSGQVDFVVNLSATQSELFVGDDDFNILRLHVTGETCQCNLEPGMAFNHPMERIAFSES